jgi:hypothetical protein
LPVFKVSRVFGLGPRAKLFFSLRGGLTWGRVPDLEYHEKLARKLREKTREHKKALVGLREVQRRNHELEGRLRKHRLENFRLSTLRGSANEPGEDTPDALSEAHASEAHASEKPQLGVLPDFVVIGAMRCGTSRFYSLLTQHPNVEHAAIKEVHYFDRSARFGRGVEWYRQCFLFSKGEDGRASITGEATPNYLYHPMVPERMIQVIPQARLIVLLRNPVDRAYSHYYQAMRRGLETRSFEEAIEVEQALLAGNGNESSAYRPRPRDGHDSNLLAKGLYADQLLRWSKYFDKQQMLVLKSEDFFERTPDIMVLVQEFLGLPYRELDLPTSKPSKRYEPMDPFIRQRLEAYFEPQNQRLYEYLGVDFGW